MRFKGEQQHEVGGINFAVIEATNDYTVVVGRATVRVPVVDRDPSRLTDAESVAEVLSLMAESVTRRKLTPKGRWIVGHTAVDWPEWRNDLDPKIAEDVSRGIRQTDGHVIVYYLFDSAEMQLG